MRFIRVQGVNDIFKDKCENKFINIKDTKGYNNVLVKMFKREINGVWRMRNRTDFWNKMSLHV